MAERKKAREGKKRNSTEEGGSTVTDGRFAHIHHDPRFERLPSKNTKVAVDARFAGVFEEKRFSQPKVDKYGRKVKKDAATGDNDLRRFYDDSATAGIEHRDKGDAVFSGSDSEADSDEAAPSTVASGERQDSDAESSAGSDGETGAGADYDESGSDSESEGEQPEWAKELENDSEAELVEMGDAHRRLAVLNCEWDRMTSTDILAIVKSFVPPGGSVDRVTVYPSEIGMKAMAEEETHGPKLDGVVPTPVTNDDFTQEDEYQEFDPDILRKYEQGKLKWFFAVVDCDSVKTAQHIYKECDGLEFERSGIVLDVRYIPDDVQFPQAPRDTATALTLNYKAPLFSNKATSSSKVELTWDRDDPARFKLRKKKFTKDEINDIDLQAYLASESDDEDEDEKEKRQAGRKKLRALLVEGENDRGKKTSDSDSDGSDGGESESESEPEDMVITFDGGLRDVGKDILEKKKQRDLEANETTWQAYLRKRAEKKAAKKAARKQSAQHNRNGGSGKEEQKEDLGFDDPFFQTQDKVAAGKGKQKSTQAADDPFDDPFFNTADDGDVDASLAELELKGKKKDLEKKKIKAKKLKGNTADHHTGRGDDDDDPIAKAQKARERAELELIVGGNDELEVGRENSFNMKHVGTTKKAKKNRSKRKQKEEDDDSDAPEDGDDGFRVDTADDRFAAIFDSHKFAIDPNDPKFKKTPAMEKILEERQERRKKKRRVGSRGSESSGLDALNEKKERKQQSKQGKHHDIAQLVASVKRKAT